MINCKNITPLLGSPFISVRLAQRALRTIFSMRMCVCVVWIIFLNYMYIWVLVHIYMYIHIYVYTYFMNLSNNLTLAFPFIHHSMANGFRSIKQIQITTTWTRRIVDFIPFMEHTKWIYCWKYQLERNIVNNKVSDLVVSRAQLVNQLLHCRFAFSRKYNIISFRSSVRTRLCIIANILSV